MTDHVTRKRHDTKDPFSGLARVNGARLNFAGVTTFEVHYKLKVDPQETIKLTGIDVEAVDGAGTPGPLNGEDGLPENRGKWRADVVDADVDIEGDYEVELECVTPEGKFHVPNARADNPTITIDPDIDDA